MYGTIAHFWIKPGTRDEFIKVMDRFGDAVIRGWRADYYFQMNNNPEEFYLVAIFEDRDTYEANANSPEQYERYLEFRSFLVDDPQWNDGHVVSATGPGAQG
jgi:quinol monooxygenase YgiN